MLATHLTTAAAAAVAADQNQRAHPHNTTHTVTEKKQPQIAKVLTHVSASVTRKTTYLSVTVGLCVCVMSVCARPAHLSQSTEPQFGRHWVRTAASGPLRSCPVAYILNATAQSLAARNIAQYTELFVVSIYYCHNYYPTIPCM